MGSLAFSLSNSLHSEFIQFRIAPKAHMMIILDFETVKRVNGMDPAVSLCMVLAIQWLDQIPQAFECRRALDNSVVCISTISRGEYRVDQSR